MLANGMNNELTNGSDGIHIDFLSAFNKFSNNHGVIRRDGGRGNELLFEFVWGVNHAHGGARQDIARAYKNGITNFLSKGLSI